MEKSTNSHLICKSCRIWGEWLLYELHRLLYEQESNLITKAESWPLSHDSLTWASLHIQIPELRRRKIHCGRNNTPNFTINFQAFLQKGLRPFTRELCHGERQLIRPLVIYRHWVWTNTTQRPNASLWFTSQRQEHIEVRNIIEVSVSQIHPVLIFPVPERIVQTGTLSNWQNACTGNSDLWSEDYHDKGEAKWSHNCLCLQISETKAVSRSLPWTVSDQDLKRKRI